MFERSETSLIFVQRSKKYPEILRSAQNDIVDSQNVYRRKIEKSERSKLKTMLTTMQVTMGK